MHRQSLIEYAKPLQATEVATPTPQGTEVLLRVSHCGVCHSDLHLQDGYFDLGGGQKLDVRSGRQLPFTFGHEIAGTVEAAGPDAQGAIKGKQYAAYPWIGCGKCGLCARGDEHMCNAPRALGITVDGGYATHVMVPHPRYLIDVTGIAPEIAGPLMCSGLTGYGAIKKAIPYLRAGPLLIVGLGGVGMMGLQFARALTDVTGFLTPTSGTIHLGDRDITGLSSEQIVHLGVARSFQITSLFDQMSLVDHVELALASPTGLGYRFWRSQKQMRRFRPRAMDLLEQVGLADRAGVLAGSLAYGQKRALELALALALDPRLLLLDEPTAGMGVEDVDRTIALVKRVANGRTVVLVDHNMHVVGSLADRVTVLQSGAVLAEGPYEQVRTDERVITAYLGSEGGEHHG